MMDYHTTQKHRDIVNFLADKKQRFGDKELYPDEYLLLNMKAYVISHAALLYSGVPASDDLIRRRSLHVPKKVRQWALDDGKAYGLLEEFKCLGTKRYRATPLLRDLKDAEAAIAKARGE